MPLDADIARIVAATPPQPPLDQIDLATMRARINEATACAPKLDVPIRNVVDRTIPGPGGPLDVRVYTPVGESPNPLLVYLHGGGYVLGNLDIADSICRAIAAGAECTVMSVAYRLAPEHPFPAGPDDAWAALSWAFSQAAAMGADPKRIAVGGDSAGGNLAAAAALRARDAGLPLAAQLLLYASPDYPDPNTASVREYGDGGGPFLRAADSVFYWSKYLADPAQRDDPMAAPARALRHDNLAPAFVASAECDPSRDLGERYAEQMRAAGTPVIARRFAGMPHGFLALLAHVPAARTAMDEICTWLTQQWASGGDRSKGNRE